MSVSVTNVQFILTHLLLAAPPRAPLPRARASAGDNGASAQPCRRDCAHFRPPAPDRSAASMHVDALGCAGSARWGHSYLTARQWGRCGCVIVGSMWVHLYCEATTKKTMFSCTHRGEPHRHLPSCHSPLLRDSTHEWLALPLLLRLAFLAGATLLLLENFLCSFHFALIQRHLLPHLVVH